MTSTRSSDSLRLSNQEIKDDNLGSKASRPLKTTMYHGRVTRFGSFVRRVGTSGTAAALLGRSTILDHGAILKGKMSARASWRTKPPTDFKLPPGSIAACPNMVLAAAVTKACGLSRKSSAALYTFGIPWVRTGLSHHGLRLPRRGFHELELVTQPWRQR